MRKYLAAVVSVAFFAASINPTPSYALTDSEEEARIGNLFDFYVTETFPVLSDDSTTAKVAAVAERLRRASVPPAAGCKVRIINDAAPLALAFPGYLYISTGLLDILENETELAAVLSLKASFAREKDSYANYRTAYSKRRFTEFISVILAAGFIVGGAMVGAAAASSATTYQSAMQSAAAWGQAGGVLAGVSLSHGLTSTVGKMPERKALLNRKGPPASWQGAGAGIDHNAVMISAQVFLNEIYGGYEAEAELRNIDDAISSMKGAGYDPAGIAVVYWKLLQLRELYLAKGYVSALFTAKPGLEEKIEHAESVLKKNR